LERGVEARSGQGSPAIYATGESDVADPSEVLPRRGKTSVPAEKQPRQDPLNIIFDKALIL